MQAESREKRGLPAIIKIFFKALTLAPASMADNDSLRLLAASL